MYALTNCDLFTGDRVEHDRAILIENGRIAALTPLADVSADVEQIDLGGQSVAPGFIDIQVNGGGGVLFNDDPSIESVEAIVKAHAMFGTTNLLPTYITGSSRGMEQAFESVSLAMTSGRAPGVLGIHFEGPFISVEKAGVHDPAYIRTPTDEDLSIILKSGAPVLLTLAPEVVELDLVRRLANSGVRVSLGHSDATYEQAAAAFAEGASATTHLYNAMSPLTSRAPGLVGAALDNRASWIGLIADGYHSAFPSARVAVSAKPRGKALLVTDAMPPVGMPNHEFRLGPYEIRVEDGKCVTPDGVLAGSALDMATAVRNCIQQMGIPKDEALRMASTYPAEFLGLGSELGRIQPGYWANLAIFNNQLRVEAIVLKGNFQKVA